jgi:uncharacterized membrane protein
MLILLAMRSRLRMREIASVQVQSRMSVAVWALIAGYLALVVAFAWDPTSFAQVLAAIGIASAMAHAVLYYGWKDALVLLAICLVITFTMENISMATGLPFGRYHFEVGAELLHIGRVPIILGPLWFGMGYFSWLAMASHQLGRLERLTNLAPSIHQFALQLFFGRRAAASYDCWRADGVHRLAPTGARQSRKHMDAILVGLVTLQFHSRVHFRPSRRNYEIPGTG